MIFELTIDQDTQTLLLYGIAPKASAIRLADRSEQEGSRRGATGGGTQQGMRA
jgi:hypothetical protein